ncbi:hypothetical protein [Flavobacterium sp. J27]|uniref:hypothetical protein n=1 Tax=Flavobacterium sp. J27 TaxID=2060419 RepID=UPI00102FFEFF|nr:hypothetical protein [Flavobacterium sp. J27]
MKTKKIVLCILMMAVFISCKNENNKPETNGKTEELKETFDVSFNLTIPKDDTFQLFYTEDGTLNFGDENSVKSIVKGSETAQTVLFKLPADVLPNQIRLDFGNNAEQGDIVVNSMKIKYLDKTYDVSFGLGKESVTHFFYLLDAQVKYDEATSTINLLKPTGKIHDPMMWSNQLLSEEMVKLYKN